LLGQNKKKHKNAKPLKPQNEGAQRRLHNGLAGHPTESQKLPKNPPAKWQSAIQPTEHTVSQPQTGPENTKHRLQPTRDEPQGLPKIWVTRCTVRPKKISQILLLLL